MRMMVRVLSVSALCIIINLSFGQDLKIDPSELHYDSEFEKKSFEAFLDKKPDYFALLLAPDETVSPQQYEQWKATFERNIASLRAELDTKKKNDKKIKFLYEKIHSQFLTKYEGINLFSQVFKDGVYNCVSATGLYSLVFDHFAIPYSIQERPTHVYLVAYPENERIQIETTTPVGGYHIFDHAFKQNYVKKLTEYKLISSVEYQSKSVDELFDRYFFNNENIDITKLIGIQYINSGLFYLDKNENEKAYHQFEKSFIFYPTEKARYLMFNILLEIFNGLSYSDEKKAVYLAKLYRFSKEGISQDVVTGEFYRITQTVFLQDGNKERYEKIYNLLRQSIENDGIRAQIEYIYNYENGRILYNQGRYLDASPFFEKALAAKPNNVDMTGIFIANLKQVESLVKDKPFFIKQLKQYGELYPTLKENNNFSALQAENILELVTSYYENGKIKEAEEYRLMFEELASQAPGMNIGFVEYQIGRAYSAGCVYYFKSGQKTKAKTIVDKGLTYAPNNYQLRSRKEILK